MDTGNAKKLIRNLIVRELVERRENLSRAERFAFIESTVSEFADDVQDAKDALDFFDATMVIHDC